MAEWHHNMTDTCNSQNNNNYTLLLPFFKLSWFSPPAWKSYKATNNCGSSSSCAKRFSLDVHRLAASKERGVDGAADPDDPDKFPTVPMELNVFVLREPGGSDSGKLGMWGKGRLCSSASENKNKIH